MKLVYSSTLIILFSFLTYSQSWIRINQLGYQEKSIKAAVLGSKENITVEKFQIKDASTNEEVYSSKNVKAFDEWGPFKKSYRLNFSDFNKPGKYYIEANGVKSPSFVINDNVYDGTADFLLKYMRQQQCGYNPLIKDSCHTHDGFIIYHPELEGQHMDATGGWHDASDYLQYVTTTANTIFQMLFAYQQNPSAFGDNFDKNGDPGKNGIPDILDQAKWGLDWLDKMNPQKDMMFNQLADDRDHRGFRSPAEDTVNYGKGLERPVYYCSGEPQGLFGNMNRTTGIASTAAKYASAFSLGAVLLEKYYPEFSKKIKQKSIDAFDYGKRNPGVHQTAAAVSPYFYEEDNWVEDMELAAMQLKINENQDAYLKDAIFYGDVETVTPWMGADSARHYQWYPFINLGHYFLAKEKDEKLSKQFVGYIWEGLNRIQKRGANNPFLFGVPFIWCSNNLVAAAVTQADLYRKLTGNETYAEMEAALRDWLFGCNPWGTSMIVGLPENGDYPEDIHSALHVHYKYKIDGGLVDGPVYSTIFNRLRGLHLASPDEYAEFQSDLVVYHDDYGDYSTNEPTMDGTASLTYYLSSLETAVKKNK